MSKTLDQYRQEANVKPFVLPVDDDTTLTVQPPDGDAFIELGSVPLSDPTAAHHILSILCGEQYDEVMGVLGKEPGPILMAVVQDMARQFGLIEQGVAPGGPRASRRS